MNTSGSPESPSTPKTCLQCGSSLPAGVLEGLCAACLLQQGAMTETLVDSGSPGGFDSLTLEEVTRLFPQLEILAFIGRGGMGAVYKARQPALDRMVALKILASRHTEPGFAERFGREARALAKLSHPNIVAVHEFGQVEGWHFFIMEYVDGVNLRQLERAGRLSAREALLIVPQICDALQFAHDSGIVHRDIKPENVLMDTRGRVKIADFGIAKILGGQAGDFSITGNHEVMGTPHYMAPEQVERPSEVDHRADIYSLGVVFYELLTGELPLGRFQPPSRRVSVDVRLDEVVLRALEKSLEMRYQTAADFRTGVETVMVPGPAAAAASVPNQDGEDWDYTPTLNDHLWKAIPVTAILLAFFNPWGHRGWLVFAAGCALLGFLPTIPLPHAGGWPWWRSFAFRTLIGMVSVVAIVLILRTFFIQTFVAASDAGAPEIPRGSHMLVWKLVNRLSPGDLIAYTYQSRACVGHVSSDDGDHVTLSHYRRPDVTVPRTAVVGKVVSVYWRGQPPAQGIAFGPVTEVTLPEPVPGASCVLSFKSGDLLQPPRSVLDLFAKGMPDLEAGALDWLRAADADLVLKMPADGSLRFIEGVGVSPAENGRSLTWKELTAAKVMKVCEDCQWERGVLARKDGRGFYATDASSPAVICFVTRDGSMGVLEILERARGGNVRLRYRMLQTKLAPVRASTASAVFRGEPGLHQRDVTSAITTPMTPREVVAAWLLAIKEDRGKDAWALTCNDNAGWSQSLTESPDLGTVKPMHQLGDDAAAMVVTSTFIGDAGRTRVVLFQLKKVDSQWRIDSHALRTPPDASLAMDGFKANPSVRYDLQPGEIRGSWHELSQRVAFRPDGTGNHQELVAVEATGQCEWMKATDLKWSVSGSTLNLTHPLIGGPVEIIRMDAGLFHGRRPDGRSFSFYRDEKQPETKPEEQKVPPPAPVFDSPK